MEILNFSSYLNIYEQEAGTPAADTQTQQADDKISAQTKNVVNLIGILYFFLLSRMMAGAKGYKDVVADIRVINSSSIDKKADELKKIFNKVADLMAEEYKKEGVDTLFKNAGDKTADAFGTLVNQYKDSKETLDSLNTYFSKRMNGHLNYLMQSKKESAVEESFFDDGSNPIFEGLFQTKKGNAKNLLKQAVALDATLDSALTDSVLKPIAEKYKTEVKQIKDRLADLSVANRKDIPEEELDKLQARLEAIPQEFNKEQEKTMKDNTSNKEASALYVEAAVLANEAIEKEAEVREKIAKEAASKKEKEFEIKRVKISEEIDPKKIETSRTNRDVQKFQGLVLDVFQSIPEVAKTELFKKFERFGADGKFGSNSQGMVVALKAGFGLEDTSRNITQELMDKMVEYADERKIKPMEKKEVKSLNNSIVYSFDEYSSLSENVDLMVEEFDFKRFEMAAKGGDVNYKDAPTKKEISKIDPPSGTATTKGNVPKVPSEVKDAVEKEGNSETTKKLKEKLLSIGFNELKNPTDGAIAWSIGMRVFPGGLYWEPATRKIGSFDPEEIIQKGENAIIKDGRGNRKSLRWEMHNSLGSIKKIFDDLLEDINGIGSRNKKLYTEILPSLSKRELEKIAHYYKGVTKRGLLQDLDDEWSNTKEIREFTRKFGDVLEKYN